VESTTAGAFWLESARNVLRQSRGILVDLSIVRPGREVMKRAGTAGLLQGLDAANVNVRLC
jgi:hypothetical protein